MDKKFTSDELPLQELLSKAHTGVLQLPDFQRGWVWDDSHISSLLASISLTYPIGAVMTLQTGNPDVQFKPRPIEGATVASEITPDLLLLDGQQRMTSLYLSLKSEGPVPTKDSKGKRLDRFYYADMTKCVDPAEDREDAIFSVPADRKVRNFRGEVQLDLSSRELELEQAMFPLGIILDSSETMNWQLKFLQTGDDAAANLELWKGFNDSVVQPFDHYQVPTIELVKSTPKEAVCQVFEKVNTGGVSLTVFELLTATYAVDNFNLRDDWDRRRARLGAWPVLEKVDATQFLQSVCLLSTYLNREKYLNENPGDEKAPGVSCKRREVLRLPREEYEANSEAITSAYEKLVPLLHTEHIFSGKDVPYASQLVPLAAVVAVLGDAAESHGGRALIARWLWSGVFGELYGGATETRFALDLPDLVAWVRADGSPDAEPRTVRDSQFQSDRLLTLRTRNSAAYKGLYALQMKRGARDFRTGNTIDIHMYVDAGIDIHHIFPQDWCSSNGVSDDLANSIINKTPIDARTNRRIGGKAPSEYLEAIEKGDKIDPAALDEILRSHDIDSLPLRQDDFPDFFSRRFERLLTLVESATGKAANRPGDGSDNPFNEGSDDAEDIQSLIALGETKVVEFKSTGRQNIHTGEKDSSIERAIAKSIAAFMNTSGGTLLVGIDDAGQAVGIEADYPFVKSPDVDGWGLWFTDFTSTRLGKAEAAEIELNFAEIDGKTVARIDVGPAVAPVFVDNGDGKDSFFVRINNSTQELSGKEQHEYQGKRWNS